MPKPLVTVAGKPLIDHVLDRLADAGVERAVVNVHYLAEQIERASCRARTRPQIVISDERGLLLGTGGGVVKALPQLGDAPFFHHQFRHDLDRRRDAEPRAARRSLRCRPPWTRCCCWRRRRQHRLCRPRRFRHGAGRPLHRRAEREVAPFVYAGAAILSPALFNDAPQGEFSLTDAVRSRAPEAGRLHGLRLEACGCMSARPSHRSRRKRAIRAERGLNRRAL